LLAAVTFPYDMPPGVCQAWGAGGKRHCSKASVTSESNPRLPPIQTRCTGKSRVVDTAIKHNQGTLMHKYAWVKETNWTHFPDSFPCPPPTCLLVFTCKKS